MHALRASAGRCATTHPSICYRLHSYLRGIIAESPLTLSEHRHQAAAAAASPRVSAGRDSLGLMSPPPTTAKPLAGVGSPRQPGGGKTAKIAGSSFGRCERSGRPLAETNAAPRPNNPRHCAPTTPGVEPTRLPASFSGSDAHEFTKAAADHAAATKGQTIVRYKYHAG